MAQKGFLGEFEQMVLLAILQCGDRAFALEVRQEIERSAERKVSRGAFYTTLDRLETKGLVGWTEESPGNARGVGLLRRYTVARSGLEALRVTRNALLKLWRGLHGVVEGT